MKFGLLLPNKGQHYGNADLLLELAYKAEQAGWEGFFMRDHIGGNADWPTMDPWICLAAIASHTQTIRLREDGHPLSRRRSWKAAREIVTLDHLSHNQAILGVGPRRFGQQGYQSLQ